jgi:4-amino-4-deoxy-L-arabinose transferase-like glycosyltransferase
VKFDGPQPARLRDLLLLLIAAIAILAPGISSLPPVDRDEPRYAVATTQMLDSGNFVDIHYQETPRYLQPAGIYWLQSIPTRLFSSPGHREIWTYRIPSLLGALIAVFVTGLMASRLFGRQTGLAAGVILASCMSLGFEARIGKTDAALLASVVVAQFALMHAYLGQAVSRRIAAAFWLALGFGVMLKGPIIFLVVGLTTLALVLWDRRAAWLNRLRPIWGAPLALLIAAPWYVAIGLVSSGQFFRTAVGHNLMGKVAAGQQAHAGPFGYHLLAFPLTFWPASLLAVMAAPFVWRERRQPAVRFLLCWLIPSWILFEAVKTKLPHYVLPTFPAIACLTAMALFSPRAAVRPWLRGLFFAFLALWVVLSTAVSVLAPVALWINGHRLDPLAIALGVGSLISVAALLVWLRRGKPELTLAAVACAAFFTTANVYAAGLPRVDSLWLSPRIADKARTLQPCPHSLLVSTPGHEPSLVFLNGWNSTFLAASPQQAAEQVAKTGSCGLAVVGERQQSDFLARAGELHMPLKAVGELEGRDYSNNRVLKLTFYRAASAGDPGAPTAR